MADMEISIPLWLAIVVPSAFGFIVGWFVGGFTTMTTDEDKKND